MKTRPCKQLVTVDRFDAPAHIPCPYPAMKGKQSCIWHWLAKQPADVQASYARARLEAAKKMKGSTEFIFRARVPSAAWPRGERWCAGCQSFIPLFYCQGSRCRSCASQAAHGARVEKTYGITPERYDELLRQQGGRCAICRNRPRSQRLAVDHNHKTDEPRGLLCKRCNHDLLGGGHDDPALLWRALEYLLFPPARFPVRPSQQAVLEVLNERLYGGPAQPPPSDLPEEAPF